MALSFDFGAIIAREGSNYVWGPDPDRAEGLRVRGRTECVIWATIFVGMPHITAANADEFAKRLRAWETIAGPISASGEPIPAETVRRHIGLRTNASPIKPAAFAKKLAEIVLRNAGEAVARETRAAVQASTGAGQ